MEALFIMRIQSSKLKINKRITENYKQKLKSKMPIVMCTCGAKILVVPDLAAMNRAIKNHLAEHKNADEQFLIKQILKVATNK